MNHGSIDVVPSHSFDADRLTKRVRVTPDRVGPLRRHTLIKSRALYPSTIVHSSPPGLTEDKATQVSFQDLLPSSFLSTDVLCSTPTSNPRDPYSILNESLRQVERLTKELTPSKKSVPTSRAVLRQPLHANEPAAAAIAAVVVVPAAAAVMAVPAAAAAVVEEPAAVVEEPFGLVIPEAIAQMELPDDLADALPVPVPALDPAARGGRGRGVRGGPPLRHSIGPCDVRARRRLLAAQMKLHLNR